MGPNPGRGEHSKDTSPAARTPGNCRVLTTSCRALADSDAQHSRTLKANNFENG